MPDNANVTVDSLKEKLSCKEKDLKKREGLSNTNTKISPASFFITYCNLLLITYAKFTFRVTMM